MTDPQLKVLILPSWYPTERYPMGGIFCEEQARALQEYGQNVDVVVLFVDRTPVGEWLRARKRRATIRRERSLLKVYRTQMPRLPVIWPLLYVVWATVSARRLMRVYRFKPDILHAHVALPAGLAGVLIKRLFGIPLVITEHTGPFSMLMRDRFAAWATRLAMKSADRVIAVSRALRDQIWAYPQLHRHIDIIPNVVDSSSFSIADRGSRIVESIKNPKSKIQNPKSKRLLFIGEMNTPIKGVDYLLGAMSLLRKRDIGCRLTLVGQGRNRREYETMARRLGVADICQFVGIVPHGDIAQLMSNSDLFVLPSLAETFGVVLVEAMSAGVPVVATRCGGPDEIVTPDIGVLVEPANSAALADGIADALSRLDQFSPAHLRQEAGTRYGQRSVAGKLVALYRQVIG